VFAFVPRFRCKQQLIDRERDLVDKEKLRMNDTGNATRERKLLSAAFYSLGFDYHAALMSGRAINRNATVAPAGRVRKEHRTAMRVGDLWFLIACFRLHFLSAVLVESTTQCSFQSAQITQFEFRII
jgi:hypothetical protein